jgi:hypothetical protein
MSFNITAHIQFTPAQSIEQALTKQFRDSWLPLPDDRNAVSKFCNEMAEQLQQIHRPSLSATQEAFADRLLIETLAMHLGQDEVGTASWTIKMWAAVEQLSFEDADKMHRLLTSDLGRSDRAPVRAKLYAWARAHALIPAGMEDRAWWK